MSASSTTAPPSYGEDASGARDVVLDIEGMTCASCVQKVERALSGVSGVEGAVVNLANRTAAVRGAPRVDELIHAVASAGYGARPHESDRDTAGEERGLRRRLAVAVPLTAAVLALTFGAPQWEGTVWVVWALATIVQFFAGWPFLRNALRAASHRATTMDTLVALGSVAAYAYSARAVIAGMSAPSGAMPQVHHYFDTGAVLVTFLLVGRTLEARARHAAGDATRALLDRGAKQATVVRDGQEQTVAIEDLRPGMRVVVRPGEKIPADGVVREGTSWVDLSLLTGESVPIDVGPGDEVVGASINGRGRLVVFVSKVGGATKLAEIVRLLEAAQGSKAPVQRLADRVSAVFVPSVILLSALTFAGWMLVGDGSIGTALLPATAVLLIACPCALGLATPAAVMAGTGRAAEIGVLFKGGEVFETARGASAALLDKTGTMTEGSMTLSGVHPLGDLSEEQVLSWAAAVEIASEHPIGRAVVDGARARDVAIPPARDHRAEPGAGMVATVDHVQVRVGRPDDLPDTVRSVVEASATRGLTPFAVWRDGVPVGVVIVADRIKPDAANTVARLRSLGLDIALVTGDRRSTAEAIASEIGVTQVLAEILPDRKLDEIRRRQEAGDRVVFIGDGLNDGPAIAAADVGIAVGTGTDVAIAAADVVLLGGSISSAADALELARRTYRVIAQNLVWAFGYNVVMIPIAAAGLLTPAWAAAAMAGSSVSVVLNALRLRRYSGGGVPPRTGRRPNVPRPKPSAGGNSGEPARVVSSEPVTHTG